MILMNEVSQMKLFPVINCVFTLGVETWLFLNMLSALVTVMQNDIISKEDLIITAVS